MHDHALTNLGLQRILTQREARGTLLGPLGLLAGLVCGEATADSTGLLGTEVQRSVLLVGVVLTESPLGRLVEDGEHTRNVLAHYLNLGELSSGSTSHLGDTQVCELSLKVIELLGKVALRLGLLAKLVALNLGHACSVSPC